MANDPFGARKTLTTGSGDVELYSLKTLDEKADGDVFFRVNQPERHYYMNVDAAWERVPGKRISYGEYIEYGLHVRTR